jgi:hypothetical protein
MKSIRDLFRKKRSRNIFLISVVFLALVLIYPIRVREIPEWKLTAVDKDGKPVAGVEVIQDWSFFSFIGESREVRVTDEFGVVVFPRREFDSPLLLAFILSATDRVNDSMSPHGNLAGGYADVWSKKTPNSQVLWYRGEASLPDILYLERNSPDLVLP